MRKESFKFKQAFKGKYFLDLYQWRLGQALSSVMEDAQGSLIQETGQEQRPARMVGHFVLILPKPAWRRVEKGAKFANCYKGEEE